MENINEKMPGEYFWGVFIPGAITAAIFYYSLIMWMPELTIIIPSNQLIKAIVFAAVSYITGLIIMQAASYIERLYYLKKGSHFPYVTLLQDKKYSQWLELFNTRCYDHFGFHIKKSADPSDASVIKSNTQSFFLYCRYLLDKNNLLQKPLNLQSEYFLFRNIALALLLIACLFMAVVIMKLFYFQQFAQKITTYNYPLLLSSLCITLLLCWFFFKTGIRKRIKYTEEVYRTAYYLLKNI